MLSPDILNCSVEGCDTIAKTTGLCNKHYMQQWREAQRGIENEVTDAIAEYGSPTSYACEGMDPDECPHTPDRWWVEHGMKTRAICSPCAERTVERMRLDIRRLELKS